MRSACSTGPLHPVLLWTGFRTHLIDGPPGQGGAVSHVYAGDPYSRDVFAARLALTEGLSALRRGIDGTIARCGTFVW